MAALVQPFPRPTTTTTITLVQPGRVSATGSSMGPHPPSSSSYPPPVVPRSHTIHPGSAGRPVYGPYRPSPSLPALPYHPAVAHAAHAAAVAAVAANAMSAPSLPRRPSHDRIRSSTTGTHPAGPPSEPTRPSAPSLTPSDLTGTTTTDVRSAMTSPSSSSTSLAPSRPVSSSMARSVDSSPPSLTVVSNPVRSTPERYRRGPRRADLPPPTTTTKTTTTTTANVVPTVASVSHRYDLIVPAHHPAAAVMTGGTMPSAYHPSRSDPVDPREGHAQRPSQRRSRSVDDLRRYGPTPRPGDVAARYRRRSTSGGLDPPELGPRPAGLSLASPSSSPVTVRRSDRREGSVTPHLTTLPRPRSLHRRHDSGESVRSTRSVGAWPSFSSRPSSSSSSPAADAHRGPPVRSPLTPLSSNPVTDRGDGPGEATVSTWSSSSSVARGPTEPHQRLAHPSPLSKPVVSNDSPRSRRSSTVRSPPSPQPPPPPSSSSTSVRFGHPVGSPAAQQLADLTEKDAKKGVRSRLRRAFSFGSAAELRRASAENSAHQASAERARLRKERYQDQSEAEQATIVQKQEAAGIGQSIYSGQGHFFTGSSDDLSVSSTASSASVMIRKMGQGMKKSTRSLVGLFRPRSLVGVSSTTDPMAATPETGAALVTMVTVEAEREPVNVNVDPHDRPGGGSSFPKLQRNSIDVVVAAAATTTTTTTTTSIDFVPASSETADAVIDPSGSRRKIVGEFERAEVLAAVKKGILKRRDDGSGHSSPVTRPVDARLPDFTLPAIPHICDSPHSSAPSTPADENSPSMGHRRTDSVRIEGEDYFAPLPRPVISDAKSAPSTPHSIGKFGVTFSPRIQFHDTWPSGEYDRRGEIATCNRLTPMLAQQIKEELNTFKMEMEVHEQSKVYTHFF